MSRFSIDFQSLKNFYHELSQIDVENLGAAPIAVRALVLAVGGAFMLLIGYMLLIAPSVDQLSQAQSDEAVLIENYAQAWRKKQQFGDMQRLQQDQNDALQQTLGRLPRSVPMAALMQSIHEQAAASGVQIDSLSSAAASEQAYYSQKPMTLVATARYREMGQFLQQLATLPWLLSLSDYSVVLKDNNQVQLTMQLHTYQANKKPQVEQSANE